MIVATHPHPHPQDRYLLSQCGLVALSQALRQLVDVLLPLVMADQQLWKVGAVCIVV